MWIDFIVRDHLNVARIFIAVSLETDNQEVEPLDLHLNWIVIGFDRWISLIGGNGYQNTCPLWSMTRKKLSNKNGIGDTINRYLLQNNNVPIEWH